MEPDNTILHSLNKQREHAIAKADSQHQQMLGLYRMCESPLEQKLLKSLTDCFMGHPCDHPVLHFLIPNYQEPDIQGFSVRIYPQYEIAVPFPSSNGVGTKQKAFRADFMVLLIPPADIHKLKTRDFTKRAIAKLIVEVDGHDFHEHTKEQAEHDKSRDRAFTNFGYQVLRFTGREINREAANKALEVFSCLNSACHKFVKQHGLRFFPDEP